MRVRCRARSRPTQFAGVGQAHQVCAQGPDRTRVGQAEDAAGAARGERVGERVVVAGGDVGNR